MHVSKPASKNAPDCCAVTTFNSSATVKVANTKVMVVLAKNEPASAFLELKYFLKAR